MVLSVLDFFVEQCQNLINFIFSLELKCCFEMEFFKFLHCAWVYSFRVVYAVLGYACLTPKKTQKDRDYPLTSGTNPLISYILLTIFFWRQMSCLHNAGLSVCCSTQTKYWIPVLETYWSIITSIAFQIILVQYQYSIEILNYFSVSLSVFQKKIKGPKF